MGSGGEQEEKKRQLFLAFNLFVSCHCQKSAQMETQVRLTHSADPLDVPVLGGAMFKHLHFPTNPHHRFSSFLSPQDKMGMLVSQGVVDTNT